MNETTKKDKTEVVYKTCPKHGWAKYLVITGDNCRITLCEKCYINAHGVNPSAIEGCE